MRILLDTSVLIAAMIESHPAHHRALPWLQSVKNEANIGLVAAHSLAETYAILTTLPVQPHIPAEVAQQLIQHNIIDIFEVVPLTAQDYVTVIGHLSDLGILGGATYDALILYAASLTNAEQIITLNVSDFRRVYPNLADKVMSP